MKIVILSEWYSEKMGYAENFLPVAFGKLGHEVHLITTDMQVYGINKDYDKIYGKYLGPKIVEQGVFKKEYFTLHRKPHSLEGGVHIVGLEPLIREISPDLVYSFEILGIDIMRAIELKKICGYKLFCESRIHLSVFKEPKTLKEKIKQLKTSYSVSKRCRNIDIIYPIAPDVYRVITKYFGVSKKKCKIASLGVDTNMFNNLMNDDSEKERLRKDIGYKDNDVVCLYTGRFTESKGPLILAKAINYLQEKGEKDIKGLFVGFGDTDYQNKMMKMRGCVIMGFVNSSELPKFYKSFDIGVWPLQESTSQLDAMSCGMPIIINDKVEDKIRVEGNGLVYSDGDYIDLANKILSLREENLRLQMGRIGSEKIKNKYSWDILASNKIQDFHNIN